MYHVLAHRRGIEVLVAFVVGVAMLVGFPSAAHAAWPLEVPAAVILAFGDRYPGADSAQTTHHGTDIAAEEGMRVEAPIAGTVGFAGRVPGSDGTSVLAVTLTTSGGTLTLMPLRDIEVSKGDKVSAGSGLGTLAGNGDGSSSRTHLHVGLRKGELYLDPMTVLETPAAAPSGSDEPAAEAPALALGSPAGAPAPDAAAPAGELARAGAPEGAARALKPAIPGAQLASGVSVAGEPVARASGTARVSPAAPTPAGTAAHSPVPGPVASARILSDGANIAGAGGGAAGSIRPLAAVPGAPLASALLRGGAQAARLGVLVALGTLGGVGALWPLYRRDRRKGLGQVRVRALEEDVATAAGR